MQLCQVQEQNSALQSDVNILRQQVTDLQQKNTTLEEQIKQQSLLVAKSVLQLLHVHDVYSFKKLLVFCYDNLQVAMAYYHYQLIVVFQNHNCT